VIILDTNVVSALMQRTPDVAVIDWLNQQPAESIWLTSITIFETRFGLALLPKGRRRDSLEDAFSLLLSEDLDKRILDFDVPAAVAAATIAAARQRAGRPVDMRDTQIAGIAMSRNASLATRNTKHFADLSVDVVNPWE
jgi:toxin FitB